MQVYQSYFAGRGPHDDYMEGQGKAWQAIQIMTTETVTSEQTQAQCQHRKTISIEMPRRKRVSAFVDRTLEPEVAVYCNDCRARLDGDGEFADSGMLAMIDALGEIVRKTFTFTANKTNNEQREIAHEQPTNTNKQ
jgi:hypothetical protein